MSVLSLSRGSWGLGWLQRKGAQALKRPTWPAALPQWPPGAAWGAPQPCPSTSVSGPWHRAGSALPRGTPPSRPLLQLELRIVLQPIADSAGLWGTWWIPSSEEDVTCPGPQKDRARTGIRTPQSPGARHVLALKLSTSSNRKIQPDGDSLLLSGPVLGGLMCARHDEDLDSSFCV